MPLLVSSVLASLFIWIAENLGTFASAWIYPSQRHGWAMVSFAKLGSWYLLIMLSFVLVSLVHKPRSPGEGETTNPLLTGVPDSVPPVPTTEVQGGASTASRFAD
jgi:hypothetical protein